MSTPDRPPKLAGDPGAEPQEPTLKQLRRDFKRVAKSLAQITRLAIEGEATTHPVFVASERPVSVGLPALAAADYDLQYNFRIAPLEQMVKVGLLEKDALTEFRDAWGNPMERACILLIEPGGGRFVFIDYPDTLR